MRKSRFTKASIVTILREADKGSAAGSLRFHDIGAHVTAGIVGFGILARCVAVPPNRLRVLAPDRVSYCRGSSWHVLMLAVYERWHAVRELDDQGLVGAPGKHNGRPITEPYRELSVRS